MTIEQIKKLVEKYPNDMSLGSKVRELYWEAKKAEQKDPNQLGIFDDEDTRDDVILGYD